jgi:hypothetical protein
LYKIFILVLINNIITRLLTTFVSMQHQFMYKAT